MRKVILLLCVTTIVFVSCKKEEEVIEQNPASTENYNPLTIGSYWVFETFLIDEQGVESSTSTIDSIIVDRDTIINGNTYMVVEGTNNPYNGGSWGIVRIIRDSLDYIVNDAGVILFSSTDFSSVLHERVEVYNLDTLYKTTYAMEETPGLITVPAGEFNVLNFKGSLITYNPNQDITNPRYLNHYYADGIGKILETYFYLSSPRIYEKRLVRYHIE